MAQPIKGKTVRAVVVLDKETAELLEAWRSQTAVGERSRSGATRCILATYLGTRGWNQGAPGFGVAWDQSGGWKLKHPWRSDIQSAKPMLRNKTMEVPHEH